MLSAPYFFGICVDFETFPITMRVKSSIIKLRSHIILIFLLFCPLTKTNLCCLFLDDEEGEEEEGEDEAEGEEGE